MASSKCSRSARGSSSSETSTVSSSGKTCGSSSSSSEIPTTDNVSTSTKPSFILSSRFMVHSSILHRTTCPLPTLLSDQRHEAAVDRSGHLKLAVFILDDLYQALLCFTAHGYHQPPARCKLVGQHLRDLGSAGGHDNGIEGRFFLPPDGTVITVIDLEHDIEQPERIETFAGPQRQGTDALGRTDPFGQCSQNSGLVPGAGADLQHLFAAGQGQHLRHQRDNIGRRDGLFFTDRQGGVIVSLQGKSFLNKDVARDLKHGIDHPAVGDRLAVSGQRPGDLILHHLFSGNFIFHKHPRKKAGIYQMLPAMSRYVTPSTRSGF